MCDRKQQNISVSRRYNNGVETTLGAVKGRRCAASSCAALKTLTSIDYPNRSEGCTSLSTRKPPSITITLSGNYIGNDVL